MSVRRIASMITLVALTASVLAPASAYAQGEGLTGEQTKEAALESVPGPEESPDTTSGDDVIGSAEGSTAPGEGPEGDGTDVVVEVEEEPEGGVLKTHSAPEAVIDEEPSGTEDGALDLGVQAMMEMVPEGGPSQEPKTCKDLDDFDENLEKNSSGEWGSIIWNKVGSDGYLTVNVNEGYTLNLCIKKGSTVGQDPFEGLRELAPLIGRIENLAVYWEYPGSGTTPFSHYAFNLDGEAPPPTILVEPTKSWTFYAADDVPWEGATPTAVTYIDLIVTDPVDGDEVVATWGFDAEGAPLVGGTLQSGPFELPADADYRFEERDVDAPGFSCTSRELLASTAAVAAPSVLYTDFYNDCWRDYRIDVDKIVTGNTAPAGATYEVCLVPFEEPTGPPMNGAVLFKEVLNGEGPPPVEPVCVTLTAGGSDSFTDDLGPGIYRVYEVPPGHADLLSTTYSGDGSSVEGVTGRVVELTEDASTASVTVTNNYRTRVPTNGGNGITPSSPTYSLSFTKDWSVTARTVPFVEGLTTDGYDVSLAIGDELTGFDELGVEVTLRAGGTAVPAGGSRQVTLDTPYTLAEGMAIDGTLPAECTIESTFSYQGQTLDGEFRTPVSAPDGTRFVIEVDNVLDCDIDVAGEVIEEPEEPAEPEAPTEPEVEEEVEESTPAPTVVRGAVVTRGLPATGASLLLLALVGLLLAALGAGGLVVPRRR